MAEFQYDVFISYSHKDEDWVVNTLLPRLEQAGAKACIDFRDFKAGKPALFNMQDSVKESRHVALVLTQNWLASEWTLFEALIGATKDPAGLQQKIIPLLCQAGIEKDLHDFIAMRTWVNFTRPDRQDIAWRQLLTALGKAPLPEPPTVDAQKEKGWFLAHPYGMPADFTGRAGERRMLTEWLEQDPDHPLLVLCALGGFGKTALAWHWLTHDVAAGRWPRVVWWSFYEGDANFENFLAKTLAYLGVDPTGLNPRLQAETLLNLLQRPGILLVLDGFERALRAYGNLGAAYQGDEASPTSQAEGEARQRDTLSPYAEVFLKGLCALPNLRGKALMTTWLRPRATERGGQLLVGCREVELLAMDKSDAAVFFRLQGIRGARAEIEAACAPYGYHPLSLRILAGMIADDRARPGDIAVAGELDLTDDAIQNKHHVLDRAYETLTVEHQGLLSRMACFRSPVGYQALQAIAGGRDAVICQG